MLPIVAKNLKLTRNGVPILNDLSVQISDQTGVTAIMGFNGAGKSILMRVLNGLIKFDSGTLLWDGEECHPEVLSRKQTLVLQKPVMLRRSVEENIKYGFRKSLNSSSRYDRLLELLELSKVAHLAKRPARDISAGEQQRVAIARALAFDPRLIYFDEPTSSLDPISAQIIENVIISASKDGKKIVLVTHSLPQVRRLAGDVIFIDRGRVAEHRSTAEFFQAPSSEAGRAFMEGMEFSKEDKKESASV